MYVFLGDHDLSVNRREHWQTLKHHVAGYTWAELFSSLRSVIVVLNVICITIIEECPSSEVGTFFLFFKHLDYNDHQRDV